MIVKRHLVATAATAAAIAAGAGVATAATSGSSSSGSSTQSTPPTQTGQSQTQRSPNATPPANGRHHCPHMGHNSPGSTSSSAGPGYGGPQPGLY